MARKTCLYDKHVEAGGKMVEFAGYQMPIQYEGIIVEHETVRNEVGLFDVSHMGKFRITGRNSEKLINGLTTNDVRSLLDGQAMYTPMCYQNGGTVDDILVYRLMTEEYLLVVNAANMDKDFQWIEDHMSSGVKLENITDSLCQLAVQGPKAVDLVQSLTEGNITDMDYYHFRDKVTVAGIDMLVSRTGYTGEDGFELYFDSKEAHRIWDLLLEVGAGSGIKPCGLGARDTLRFEAGMPLYGNELSKDINPLEAGLSYFIKFEKEAFVGKNALEMNKENRQRKMVGFELIDKGMARHGAAVVDTEGNTIGTVTTGYKSPTFGKTIGIALVPWQYDEDELLIRVRKKILRARKVGKRFFETYGYTK